MTCTTNKSGSRRKHGSGWHDLLAGLDHGIYYSADDDIHLFNFNPVPDVFQYVWFLVKEYVIKFSYCHFLL